MTLPLLLLAPDTADRVQLTALLTRIASTAPHLHVRVAPLGTLADQGSVQVPLVLDGATRGAPTAGVARPLGPHPALVADAADRVAVALDGRDPASTAVLLVGPGGHPETDAELAKVARLLQEGRDLAFVEHAYLATSEPGIAAGLDRCRRLGADHVVVLPYALLDTTFRDTVAAACPADAGVDVVVADGPGDSDALAAVILERHHEVLHGDLRTNCDVCPHR